MVLGWTGNSDRGAEGGNRGYMELLVLLVLIIGSGNPYLFVGKRGEV